MCRKKSEWAYAPAHGRQNFSARVQRRDYARRVMILPRRADSPTAAWRLLTALVASVFLGSGSSACGSEEEDGEAEQQQSEEEDNETEDDEGSGEASEGEGSESGGEQESATTTGKGEESDEDSGGSTTGGEETTTPSTSSKDTTGSGIEPSDYCKDVAKWDPEWVKLEDEILRLVNEIRAKGAECGKEGSFEATTPVKLDEKLRCAARVHSKDMGERNFFAHLSPDGETPFHRIAKAGYKGGAQGENIAAGGTTAEGTMKQWIDSDGHCANLMNPSFKFLGVGYYPKPGSTYRYYWTQNFGG